MLLAEDEDLRRRENIPYWENYRSSLCKSPAVHAYNPSTIYSSIHPCILPSFIHPSTIFDIPGAARCWTWAGTWTLASEARVRRPPFAMRSHSREMCLLSRSVSRGRPSICPPVWASDVAWSLGLRERQVRRRWETAASQLSSQPWGKKIKSHGIMSSGWWKWLIYLEKCD